MEQVEVWSERGSYPVVVGHGLIDRLGEHLDHAAVARPRSLVSDRTVGPLWARRAAAALGCGPPLELPDGEPAKRWHGVETICAAWLVDGVHRGTSVAAVGGGVVTDLTGFAAAVYLRGVTWLAVPTTLLAMVDAAIGGKTGVNLDQGKNLVGAFWPPAAVVVDLETLTTLPPRELRAGLAEVVKAAWIADPGLLDLIERPITGTSSLPPEAWRELVVRAVQVKAAVVAADEREAGPRRALNLGHTLAHALEMITGYTRFLHGEAVAWGLLAVVELSRRRGLLDAANATRLVATVDRLGPLPPIADLAPEHLLAALAVDKKRDDRGPAWVLPCDGGVVLDQRVGTDELAAVLAHLATTSATAVERL